LISIENTATYSERKFGLILDVNNANISHAYYSNTGSGSSKGLFDFVEEISNNLFNSLAKNLFTGF